MKTLQFAYELLKFSAFIWVPWLHTVDGSLSCMLGFEDNEVDIDNRLLKIVPGTKWCGDGNISTDYDDLGTCKELDKCCRAHDNCPDVIEAGQTKHNLTNEGKFTKLSCDCDQAFYNCLKGNNELLSGAAGLGYFDIIQRHCFKEDYPIVGCKQEEMGLCQEYELDETKPKIWQWFENPYYLHTQSSP